jgi:NADP-reducing hydrogenase subunit HndC
MNKITSPEDLLKIKNDYAERMKLREEAQEVTPAKVSGLNTGTKRIQILCCSSVCCLSSKSGEIADRFCQLAKEQNVADRVDVIRTGCFGFCEKGPNVKIVPDNTFYTEVKPDDADEIFKTHILGGKRVDRLLFEDPKTHKRIPDSKDMNFYRKQMRVALRNCCFIDPEDIKEYIARDGYMSLANCLKKMTPKEVIEIVKKSGLRGRGGAGFPTGMKWEFASKSVSDVKYVVCNADEGDPGAFMDRSIMEGDPNSIIEAMAICGYAIGSENGLVYIRAEYPLAVKRLKIAREQARKLGLLGKNIFGSKFSFDIDIRYGAGAFVCGEETALIHSMEGKRGEPTLKPPFPAVKGYLGKPTNVNNVETLANIPPIFLKGPRLVQ